MSENLSSPIKSFYTTHEAPESSEPAEVLVPAPSAIGGFVNDTSIKIDFIQILPTGDTAKTKFTLPHGMNIHSMDKD